MEIRKACFWNSKWSFWVCLSLWVFLVSARFQFLQIHPINLALGTSFRAHFFVINSYRICLYHVGWMIFYMKRKKNLKNMLEKMLCHAGMTWQYEKILGHHTSRRIYGRNIFSTWCLSISHDTHSPVRGTRAGKFTVRLPRKLIAPFHSFCMRNGW